MALAAQDSSVFEMSKKGEPWLVCARPLMDVSDFRISSPLCFGLLHNIVLPAMQSTAWKICSKCLMPARAFCCQKRAGFILSQQVELSRRPKHSKHTSTRRTAKPCPCLLHDARRVWHKACWQIRLKMTQHPNQSVVWQKQPAWNYNKQLLQQWVKKGQFDSVWPLFWIVLGSRLGLEGFDKTEARPDFGALSFPWGTDAEVFDKMISTLAMLNWWQS